MDHDMRMAEETVAHVGLGFLSVIIFICNVIVVVTIFKCEHLHVPSNIFVAGIAMADTGVGLVILPFYTMRRMPPELSYATCTVIYSSYIFISDMSIYMVLGFTFDRLFAISFQLAYRRDVNCRKAVFAVAFIFFIGMSLAFVPVAMSGDLNQNYNHTCEFHSVISMTYVVNFRYGLIVLGQIIIIVIANVYIMYIIRRYTERHCYCLCGGDLCCANEFNAERLLLKIIAACIVCHGPLAIVEMMGYYGSIQVPYRDTYVWDLLISLYYSNSLIDPFIYAFSSTSIKKAIKNVILCRPIETNRTISPRHRTLESHKLDTHKTSTYKSIVSISRVGRSLHPRSPHVSHINTDGIELKRSMLKSASFLSPQNTQGLRTPRSSALRSPGPSTLRLSSIRSTQTKT